MYNIDYIIGEFMSIPKADICPELPQWATQEITNLTAAVARVTRGLDPASLAKSLLDSAAEDITTNGAAAAKAASEGIGSEYTQKLIKSSVDAILEEITKTFPEANNVVQKIKNFSDISFSLIQIVINMTDNSPLVIASKVKKTIIDEIGIRRQEFKTVIAKIEELNATLAVLRSRGPIIGSIVSGMANTVQHLDNAESYLMTMRTKLIKKILDTPSLNNAKASLMSALETLSPLDTTISGTTISTNEELADLYYSGVSEIDIKIKLLNAKYTQRFNYSDDAIRELRNIGMSESVETIFRTLQFKAQNSDPSQVLLGKIRRTVSELTEVSGSLLTRSTRIARLLNNYLTISLYLDKPKNQETNAQDLYYRIIDNLRSRISKLKSKIINARENSYVKRTPGVKQDQVSDIEYWIAEIVAMLAVLDIVKMNVYEEKKINSTPANTIYYTAYENSVKKFEDDKTYNFELSEIEDKLAFIAGADLVDSSIANAQAMALSTEQEEINQLFGMQQINLISLKSIGDSMEVYENIIISYLNIYTPEPDVSSKIDSIIKMMEALGFDRLKDKFLEGDLEELYNMVTDEATYLGAASKCIKSMAEKAETEAEKKKFMKVALKLDKTNRTRFLGRVHVSTKSIQALRELKDRVVEVEGIIQSLIGMSTNLAKTATENIKSVGGI